MSKRLAILALLAGLGVASAARAQSTRTWVSGVGDDANPCSRTAPCLTFAGAFSKTAAGGEIDVLDPGDFGTITITKAITIAGTHQLAGIQAAGIDAITVAAGAADVVVLRDLSLAGDGSVHNGVTFNSGKTLRVEGCTIEGFGGDGIDFDPTGGGELFVRNVVARDNLLAGLVIGSGGTSPSDANIERTTLAGNGIGLSMLAGGTATFYDGVLANNAGAGLSLVPPSGSAEANIEDATIAYNALGIDSEAPVGGSATARLSNTLVGEQSTGLTKLVGAGSIQTYGNDRFVWPAGATCASGYVTLTPTSFPGGTTGTPYSAALAATGALGTATFSESGALPAGLALADGVLSGTPTAAGSYPVTFSVVDSDTCTASVSATLSIVCPTITVSPATLAGATTGVVDPITFTASGGTGTTTLALTGTLPIGLEFSQGAISGYPTQPGTFPFTVTATDANSCVGSTQYSLTVAPSASYQGTTLALQTSTNPTQLGTPIMITATLSGATGSPTGNVSFFDGATALGSSAVTADQASLSATLVGVGLHTLTAQYGGDQNYGPSTAPGFAETVDAASTTTALISSGPSNYADTVTLTATVSSNGGIPGGSVAFLDGTTMLGTATLDATGTATLQISTLEVGMHSITAQYGATTSFLASASTAVIQVVSAAPTTTVLVVTGTNTFGSELTLTATVTAANGLPYLSVEFFDGTTSLGSAVLNGSAQAILGTATLAGGVHSLTAVYGGSTDFLTSTSAPVMQAVNPLPTTTVLTVAGAGSLGAPVTLTATVTTTGFIPGGSVQFLDGTTVLNTTFLGATGTATFLTGSLTVGTHSLTASYAGNANFLASTSSAMSAVITAAATTTTLMVMGPGSLDSTLNLTATVASAAGTPTGTVTFLDGTTTLGMGTLDGSGAATFSTTTLAQGSHTLTAQYGGSANFLASTSAAVGQVIGAAATTTTLTSSGPTTFGGSVTFTATVTSVAGTPTGSLTFLDGTTTLSTAMLSGTGTATFTTTTLEGGNHSITATYAGSATYAASTSAVTAQVVSAATTATTLVVTGAAPLGSLLTLKATVTSPAGTPTGNVTFFDGTTPLAHGMLDASGTASFSTATLASGSHSLMAVFAGSSDYLTSSSVAVVQNVTGGVFTVAVSQAPEALPTGQSGVTAQLTVAVVGTLAAPITFTCTDLPAGAKCSFTPPQVAATPGGTLVTVTVSPATTTASNEGGEKFSYAFGALGPSLLLGLLRRRGRGLLHGAVLVVGLAMAAGLGACSSSKSTPPAATIPAGTYHANVVATSASQTVTTPLTFTVQ